MHDAFAQIAHANDQTILCRFFPISIPTEASTLEDKKAFVREIELMKSVGHHQNILGIIGHKTNNFNKMMLVTEYCSEGNLHRYLA